MSVIEAPEESALAKAKGALAAAKDLLDLTEPADEVALLLQIALTQAAISQAESLAEIARAATATNRPPWQ